jgi:hypothetical protein
MNVVKQTFTNSTKDEQIHQLYELMQAIQNRGKEGGEQES